MKAGPVEIGTLLQNRNRYCIPIYQRHYVWNREKQWEPFWQDIRTKAIERLAGRERRFSHFMGAVVLESRAKPSVKQVPSFQVVDGQQRLTTFQLFLTAARHYAQAIGHETTEGNINRYVLNSDPHLMEDPDVEIYKVWPTQSNRQLFVDIVSSENGRRAQAAADMSRSPSDRRVREGYAVNTLRRPRDSAHFRQKDNKKPVISQFRMANQAHARRCLRHHILDNAAAADDQRCTQRQRKLARCVARNNATLDERKSASRACSTRLFVTRSPPTHVRNRKQPEERTRTVG